MGWIGWSGSRGESGPEGERERIREGGREDRSGEGTIEGGREGCLPPPSRRGSRRR